MCTNVMAMRKYMVSDDLLLYSQQELRVILILGHITCMQGETSFIPKAYLMQVAA